MNVAHGSAGGTPGEPVDRQRALAAAVEDAATADTSLDAVCRAVELLDTSSPRGAANEAIAELAGETGSNTGGCTKLTEVAAPGLSERTATSINREFWCWTTRGESAGYTTPLRCRQCEWGRHAVIDGAGAMPGCRATRGLLGLTVAAVAGAVLSGYRVRPLSTPGVTHNDKRFHRHHPTPGHE